MVTDAENRIIEVNPAFTSVTGYPPEEVIGQSPAMLFSQRYSAEFFQNLYRKLSQEGNWRGEHWSRHKNGHDFIGWLSIKQVRNLKGELTHNVAAFSDITDRKHAQEAQLRAVLEASPEAVVLVDKQGLIAYANRVSEQVFGYTRKELKGLRIETLVPQEYRDNHQHYRSHFSETPRSRPMASGIKLSALCKDGKTFPAEISLSPIHMGEDDFVIAAVSDISQRIRDEETLRASEQRWKFALEGSGEGVWDWDIASGQTLFAPRILDFWGCPENSGEGRLQDWTERIHPDDKERFMAGLNAHLCGQTATFAMEHRTRYRDGSWKWALARGMVVSHQPDGAPQRMIGTYVDISERKKIEEDFKDLLQFNQSVIANSFSGIMVHKYSGECVIANEAAARISGGAIEQLLLHNFRRSQSWRESGAYGAAEKALESGAAIDFESPMHTFFGRTIWCVASFKRLSFKGESYLLSVFNDLSIRKQAENALLEAKENAEALLDRARMAERRIIDISEETRKNIGQELHDDLGQHLTGVAFLSEVLFQKLKSMDYAEMQEAANITTLINEAVAKTRHLAQGLYPVELQETGLQALLTQTARNVENIYRIRCSFAADPDLVIKDFQTEINLFRIAQEAINNALRHGAATDIRIRLGRQKAALLFEIADNGCGFESNANNVRMSGLGMHTMQYRASLIGATLEIRSLPGQGTTVRILLPTE
ncbi:MAG: Sensor histidine kinase LiaS [Proteobacteria bacterium]|nr:Sensor histidine kinase LiaS [Pseudomonadota bacterium]